MIIAGTALMWLQLKVQESKFNEVPAGNCDIPCTSAVLRVVIWKIGACNESSYSIKICSSGTTCNDSETSFGFYKKN